MPCAMDSSSRNTQLVPEQAVEQARASPEIYVGNRSVEESPSMNAASSQVEPDAPAVSGRVQPGHRETESST